MPKVLIAGCGFVGLATARLFAGNEWEVIGLTHSAESAAALAGESFRVAACDIGERASVEALTVHGPVDVVIHCASSGRGGVEQYRRVYFEGMQHLAATFPEARLIFTSSTSVYAQTDGSTVTEESPAIPDRETGQILRATEDLVLARQGVAARLAGIYGPGRSVLLRKFFDGTAMIDNDGSKWINQVHRDDIASALLFLATAPSGVYNVGDDRPLTQQELYTWLAEHFSRPLPPSGAPDLNRKRGWTNKSVSNAKLRGLGWQPRFPSFFDAVTADPHLHVADADASR